MTDPTELESADAYCRRLTRRHYENFAVISLFLPAPIRTHLARVYAFCRTTDDFGDESGGLGLQRLERWKQEVESCFDSDSAPTHPVLIALAVSIRECGLGSKPFLDLIQANVQDQTVSSYETWDELNAYCMLSAATVGRMVLGVFAAKDDRTTPLSDSVCIGLQLANHAQDVKRDADRGRSYLLQTVVRESGVPAGIRDLTDRAQQLLAAGVELESMVPARLAAQLSLYRRGGLEVVKAIRALGYRTDLARPTVSLPTKVALTARTVAEGMALMKQVTHQGVR